MTEPIKDKKTIQKEFFDKLHNDLAREFNTEPICVSWLRSKYFSNGARYTQDDLKNILIQRIKSYHKLLKRNFDQETKDNTKKNMDKYRNILNFMRELSPQKFDQVIRHVKTV